MDFVYGNQAGKSFPPGLEFAIPGLPGMDGIERKFNEF
jgi:hypothetical protein